MTKHFLLVALLGLSLSVPPPRSDAANTAEANHDTSATTGLKDPGVKNYQALAAEAFRKAMLRREKYPPDHYILAVDGLGECSIALFEKATVKERNEYLRKLLIYNREKKSGPPPHIEVYKIFWATLADGTCIFSDAPDHWGKPYVRGRLKAEELSAAMALVHELATLARDPELRYPYIIDADVTGVVYIKAKIDGDVVPIDISMVDLKTAQRSESLNFTLTEEQALYRQRFADLVTILSDARQSAFEQISQVPESAAVHPIMIPLPGM